MNHEYQRKCGQLGRKIQILQDTKAELESSYSANKARIAEYELCLAHANKQADLSREWAIAATAEMELWKARALPAEAKLFELQNNR